MLKFFKDNSSFIKFCIVGSMSTLLDMGIYFVLFDFGGPVVAKIISMTCSMVFSYNLNKKWSFRVSTERTNKEISRYFVTQMINISVNVGTNYLILLVTEVKMLAFIIATIVAMSVNYLLQRYWVFGGKK